MERDHARSAFEHGPCGSHETGGGCALSASTAATPRLRTRDLCWST